MGGRGVPTGATVPTSALPCGRANPRGPVLLLSRATKSRAGRPRAGDSNSRRVTSGSPGLNHRGVLPSEG
jgi:hypothetical protein